MAKSEGTHSIGSPGRPAGGRNPLVVFAGFLLLGSAAALLLFGANLVGQRAAPDDDGSAILDQLSAFPTVSAGIAQIPAVGSAAPGVLAVGDAAHDFELSDLEGNMVRLSDFRGRPVIINLWATWCTPCRIEMPELQAAFERYQEQGLVILALNQDETAEVAGRFFDELGLSFTPLLDDNSLVAASYGAFGVLPTTYFIDRTGLITAIHRGPLTETQIDDYLVAALEERG
jgi:cytochrome c biogenesis protein CcmG, thiol:disulfide interchange protein DsbE